MASLKTPSVAESGATFSYAQAAKGRSPSVPATKTVSSAPSGSATPSSASLASESTPASSWADESDAKASVSSTSAQSQQNTPQTRQPPRRVDSSTSSSLQSPSAPEVQRITDKESTASGPSTEQEEDNSITDTPTATDAQAPVRPVLQEARQPIVNIWAQRAADAKAKATAFSPEVKSNPATTPISVARASPETTSARKTDASVARRPDAGQTRGRQDARNGPQSTSYPAGAQRRSLPHNASLPSQDTAPPPMTGNSAWPKPTDVKVDDKRRDADKDEDADGKDDVHNRPHGKTEWKVMPYTPTAVFETPVYGKGSGRMGNGASGNTRTSASGPSTRAGQSSTGKSNGTRASSVPNENTPGPKDEAAQKMPPPPVPGARETANDAHKNGEDFAPRQGANLPKRQQSLRRIETSKRNGTTDDNPSRSAGHAPATQFERGLATAGADSRDSRRSLAARGSDDAGREPRKSGKKSNRNSYANGSHSSAGQYLNGSDFQPGFAGHQSFVPRNNATFAGSGSRGGSAYRGPARSQSIPMDSYNRPHGGYSYPGQVVPEMYSSYPMHYPVLQGTEREMHVAAVTAQLEYYFSMDNLLKDMFLRKHMDSQGWIFLAFIADFNRLKLLTTDYELLKTTCLQSSEIEIKVGEDGKDRVRKAQGWGQFVLPLEERDHSAQHAGPQNVRRPSFPQGETPYTYTQSPPSGTGTNGHPQDRIDYQATMNGNGYGFSNFDPRSAVDFQPGADSRGRQLHTSHNHNTSYVDHEQFAANGGEQQKDEPDSFPSSQIRDLTVVARKHEPRVYIQAAPNGRSFSDGGIDSRDLAQEIENLSQGVEDRLNGFVDTTQPDVNSGTSQDPAHVALLWVKGQQTPIESPKLPNNTVHEFYTDLRVKALEQRDAAATGACPYDLDVLYQFWSHFLIRNFNLSMYNEFRHLAFTDAEQRHSDVGMKALIKYYNESLCSQSSARVHVINDFVMLLKSESLQPQRPAFQELQHAWSSRRLNIKNRKKLNDQISNDLRTELDA